MLVIMSCRLYNWVWLLHFSLGSLHITFFPLRFPGNFQFNSSKSSVFSNTFLLFKFWEVTKANRNSLYCFGSFLSSLDQLEGKFIMPGTGLFKKIYLLLVFHLLEEALSFHVTKPSLELHICTLSKLMCFLIAFPNILSVTPSSASNCSIVPISSFTAPVFSYPPSWSSFLLMVPFYFPGFWDYFSLYTHTSRFGARIHK